ncbi:hypothetical protein GT348_07770 [Aristophania vespae]|uniref:Uncharacterized protein n=1 Tax=Aristophania vespae TaxID=2697033 RepID=A0A6P1NHY9_9PROT|nr:hypothetical protein [Aristophania vespae]QHI96144.1 hypothetical protein GT348_07770 [Aristophania vespae]
MIVRATLCSRMRKKHRVKQPWVDSVTIHLRIGWEMRDRLGDVSLPCMRGIVV